MRRTFVPTFVLATLAAGCATSLGDNVGADISASGSTVVVSLSEQHAWLPQLQRQGAELVAEYTTVTSGLVREVLGSSQRDGERGVAFRLPDSLRGVPTDQVCLYVQLRANRSVLPVRRASGGQDTGHFHHAEWEKLVRAGSEERRQRTEVESIVQRLAMLDQTASRRRQSLATRGWMQPEQCDAIVFNAASPSRPPIGVVPVDRHLDTAKQVCINRAVYSSDLRQRVVSRLPAMKSQDELQQTLASASSLAGMIQSSANLVLQMKTPPDATAASVLAARQQQSRAYLEDFQRLSPALGPNYYPAFGKPDDYMGLIADAKPLHRKAILLENAERLGIAQESRPVLNSNELLGLIGGMLDAYSGCVSDGQRELRVKLDAWADLQRESPERNRRIKEYFVKDCKAQHAGLVDLESERARLEAQRTAAVAEMSKFESLQKRGQLSNSRVSLNSALCR